MYYLEELALVLIAALLATAVLILFWKAMRFVVKNL